MFDDPGDFVGFSLGMGFGINKRNSFSLGYDHTIVFKSDWEGLDARNEFDRIQVGSLLLGFNHQISDASSVNFSLSVGVTEDAPDVQLTLRSPIRLF